MAKRRNKRKSTGEQKPASVVPIAPKPPAPRDEVAELTGDGYRQAARDEKPLRPPSDIPAARVPILRNRLLVIAVWTVLIYRFAIAVRAHGLSGRAALMGFLSAAAILPIVIGAILLVVRDR